jgi:hypothetical protein
MTIGASQKPKKQQQKASVERGPKKPKKPTGSKKRKTAEKAGPYETMT